MIGGFSSGELTNNQFSHPTTNIQWDETSIDFGEIEKDKPASAVFEFENKGSSPVVITSVKASCGCTATKYTKKPIPAGEKGMVKVTYNAKKQGPFKKYVKVMVQDVSEPYTLTIKGKVKG